MVRHAGNFKIISYKIKNEHKKIFLIRKMVRNPKNAFLQFLPLQITNCSMPLGIDTPLSYHCVLGAYDATVELSLGQALQCPFRSTQERGQLFQILASMMR